MKKLLILLLSFGLLIVPHVKAETVLYCQSELAIGLIKKNGLWKESSFNKKRFTVQFNNDYSSLQGKWGADFPMDCQVIFPYQIPNQIICVNSEGMGDTFMYDKKSKRFLFSSLSAGGYVENSSDADTEVLYAGTCEVF